MNLVEVRGNGELRFIYLQGVFLKTGAQANITLFDKNCFQLRGQLNFSSVPALVKVAVKALHQMDENTGFEVDLSKVEHGDSAGIAMLLELNRVGLALNKTMRIKNISQQMKVIAQAYGVNELLATMLEC